MSVRIFLIAFAGVGLLVLPRAQDRILYNPSHSIPLGFYERIDGPAREGALVTVRARDVAADYACARNFCDRADRFIKRVAAMSGARVCAGLSYVSVAGVRVPRAKQDGAGRALPQWQGCRALADDEVFLLGDTADSFDGRYWGPTPSRLIEGVWRPL